MKLHETFPFDGLRPSFTYQVDGETKERIIHDPLTYCGDELYDFIPNAYIQQQAKIFPRTNYPISIFDPQSFHDYLKKEGSKEALYYFEASKHEGTCEASYSHHLKVIEHRWKDYKTATKFKTEISQPFETAIEDSLEFISMLLSRLSGFLRLFHENYHLSEQSPPEQCSLLAKESKEYQKLSHFAKTLEAAIAKADEDVEQAHNEAANLLAQIDDWKEISDRQEETISSKNLEIRELQEDLEEMRSERDELAYKINTNTTQIEGLRGLLETLNPEQAAKNPTPNISNE